jgi:vitamin B12/bleomycin/antimicrobial peptide transport system ATP-binding/permease protein
MVSPTSTSEKSGLQGRVSAGVLQQARALFNVLAQSPGRTRLLLVAIGLVIVIGATALAQLRLNAWNKPFYDAIQHREGDAFLSQLVVFGVIAGSLLLLNVSQTWLDQTAKLEMREWLTRDLLAQWMAPKRAFLLVATGLISPREDIAANPDQRIHDDTRRLTEMTGGLAIGCFQSTLLLASFIGVLWSLSQGFVLTVGGRSIVIPGFMLWCALIYAASGALLSRLIGRPLIEIGVTRAAREGDLRFALVRVSEGVDGIALAGGNSEERQRLEHELAQVITVMRRFAGWIAGLTSVTAGYGWAALVVPIVVAAPAYFAGQLTFGELMVAVGAFNQVQQSLRWFVDNSSAIADWRAALARVMDFREVLLSINEVEKSADRIELSENSKSLILNGVIVRVTDREIGLDVPSVDIQPGEHAVIIGETGRWNAAFFRAVAGLWPWGRGKVALPPRTSMAFLLVQPYVPAGSLRDVLAYPDHPEAFQETDVIHALERTNLGHLVPALERVTRWDKILNLDERLHLSLAQLILRKPRWIIADESIARLNEHSRKMVLSLFENELSNSTLISITTEDTRDEFYSRTFHLVTHGAPHS